MGGEVKTSEGRRAEGCRKIGRRSRKLGRERRGIKRG